MKILIIALSFITFSSFGQDVLSVRQNLINNPSFESYDKCPKRMVSGGYKHMGFIYTQSWNQVHNGTSDLYSICSKKCGVPKNGKGFQEAKEGTSYIGMVLYNSENKPYQEAVQTKLKKPLIKHHYYYVEYSYSLADKSGSKLNTIDWYVGDSIIKEFPNVVESYIPIRKTNTNVKDLKENWITNSMIYQAKGGEQFFAIGSFIGNRVQTPFEFKKRNIAYYYIDDVKLYEIGPSIENGYSMQMDSLNNSSTDSVFKYIKNLREQFKDDLFIEFTTNDKILVNNIKEKLKNDKTINQLKVDYIINSDVIKNYFKIFSTK